MNNFENIIIIFILLIISNFLLKLLFRKLNYITDVKKILYDSIFISSILMFWYIILYYFWIFSEYNTIDLWFEIVLYLILFILFPYIYIYTKKKYLIKNKIKISIYYPLIEILIIILSLSIVSYLL